jgi:restriction system protein
MITTTTPDTWQDLQLEVARILRECGFTVDVERRVETVRGAAVIDVYATETVDGRSNTILVECKNWKTRLPQREIHAFRTVVADCGANVGYVVSAAGFQSGAFSAAELTNLRLVTWDMFQTAFETTWIERFLLPTITDQLDPLFTYTEPLLPRWFSELDERGQHRYLELRERHAPLDLLIFILFASYQQFLGRELPTLPLRGKVPEEGVPAAVLDAEAYRDLLDAALPLGYDAIAEFRALRPGAAID